LFYRFSDKTVYYRYFSPIKVMPHAKMQQYVNIDYIDTLSIVGLSGSPEEEHIVAEARFAKDRNKPYGDVAFVVEEQYQGMGIATYLYEMLVSLAKERGLHGFTADVLASNKAMMKVFEKGRYPVRAGLSQGVYELVITF
ncbi:MAG: GNAT family N-acetyltransferase, partial [Desulfomonilia bacterium]